MPAHHLDKTAIPTFANTIVSWQKQHGRHDLPWQGQQQPYQIWLAEIMLQQTQVQTVRAYYVRFLERFPTLEHLAQAPLEEVMPYWAGLGYYARARNLHRCAQIIVAEHQGCFPPTQAELQKLPGIGPSTAAAIAAFAFAERVSILDGNVKRVLARFAGVRQPVQQRATERLLWDLAQSLVQAAPLDLDMAAYTQGLMDLGALVCTRGQPTCSQCPLQNQCYAYQHQLTTDLPTALPKRAYPTRKKHMLIWLKNKNVLLQQRPPKGIWGGLLALPESTQQKKLLDFAPAKDYLSHQDLKPLPKINHRFTHFALQIQPWLAISKQPEAQLPKQTPSPYHWTAFNALVETALPAPIKKLLHNICLQQHE